MIDELKPWLNNELFHVIKGKGEAKEEMQKESTEAAKKIIKDLGVVLPEGVEVVVEEQGDGDGDEPIIVEG